jgi:hypothetical protein
MDGVYVNEDERLSQGKRITNPLKCTTRLASPPELSR